MHRFLGEYPPAPEQREKNALEFFPYKEISAEEYAAREAHNWVCFNFDNYVYRDSALNEWIHTLGDIFSTQGAASAAREKYLTKEQLEEVKKSGNQPL